MAFIQWKFETTTYVWCARKRRIAARCLNKHKHTSFAVNVSVNISQFKNQQKEAFSVSFHRGKQIIRFLFVECADVCYFVINCKWNSFQFDIANETSVGEFTFVDNIHFFRVFFSRFYLDSSSRKKKKNRNQTNRIYVDINCGLRHHLEIIRLENFMFSLIG